MRGERGKMATVDAAGTWRTLVLSLGPELGHSAANCCVCVWKSLNYIFKPFVAFRLARPSLITQDVGPRGVPTPRPQERGSLNILHCWPWVSSFMKQGLVCTQVPCHSDLLGLPCHVGPKGSPYFSCYKWLTVFSLLPNKLSFYPTRVPCRPEEVEK